MKERGCRDEMVIATKFTANFRAFEKKKDHDKAPKIVSNFGGNGTKSLKHSLEASLRKLQTDYIDIMYMHCISSMLFHDLVLMLTSSRVGIHRVHSRTNAIPERYGQRR
jgi:aryl-alcohol dehydrogenase-like predicted oxidoreductase